MLTVVQSNEVSRSPTSVIEVRAPRVNDKRIDQVSGERQRFASAILPASCRRPPKVSEVSKLITAAQDGWRVVNATHLVALVGAGTRFEKGVLIEREAAPAPAPAAA